ncbi:MAG: hypothetical protein SOW25_06190, partial [Helicobacter sp.]|nr:hypothetical protein [Helicobacter sp.]
MVKHCLLLLFLCGILNAQIAQNTQEVQNNQNLSQSNLAPLQNPVDYKVMQLLGGEAYRVNQKFIQRLFSNQGYFLDSTKNPDLYKIARTLKQNGLLKLKFAKPMELEIAFIVDENPQTFISTLYDCLNAMGYYYFLVKQSTLEDKQFKFVLSMNTEYA